MMAQLLGPIDEKCAEKSGIFHEVWVTSSGQTLL